MKKATREEIREWINTGASFFMLVVAVVGLFYVAEITLNLEELRSKEISAKVVYLLDDDDNKTSCIYNNETHLIMEGNCSVRSP